MHEKLIQYNFNKAAHTYIENKDIQIKPAEKIEAYLFENALNNRMILDLGSGPGTFKNIPQVVLYDLSLNMLKISNFSTKINGNASKLPFCDKCFPIITSNLMLQWLNDKNTVFKEVFDTLKDKGFFIYTTLINDSLWELKHAFKQIDNKPHTIDFVSENEYLDLANKNNFSLIHKEIWEDTLFFDDIYNLLMHFKLTGTNIPKSTQGLGGRKNLKLLENTYPKINNIFRNSNNLGHNKSIVAKSLKYPLTYKYLLMVLQK